MLSEKEISEIREHLEKSSNPLFFFDNDVDGLASFLILARKYGKGKGVAIKSGPDLSETYVRKIEELNPDYIFVLDKPLINKKFVDEVKRMNLPLIWIDHHDIENPVLGEIGIPEGIFYYNPKRNNKKSDKPTTFLAWKIAENKKDLWLALCGCVSDNYLPDFIDEVEKEYPEMISGKKSAFQVLYDSEIGKVTRIMAFGLKDRTSNVVRMLKILLKVSSPREILDDLSKNQILSRFNQIDKKYQKLLEKAKDYVKEKMIYFQYGGDLSLSSDIANELSYKYPGKYVIVAYISGVKANISLRGKNVKDITSKAILGLENATGGGHQDATGCKVNVEDLETFKERVEKLIND